MPDKTYQRKDKLGCNKVGEPKSLNIAGWRFLISLRNFIENIKLTKKMTIKRAKQIKKMACIYVLKGEFLLIS